MAYFTYIDIFGNRLYLKKLFYNTTILLYDQLRTMILDKILSEEWGEAQESFGERKLCEKFRSCITTIKHFEMANETKAISYSYCVLVFIFSKDE